MQLPNDRGMTLVEILVAITILVVGLIAVLNAVNSGYLNVVLGVGQARAATYGRQLLEQFKNQPFTVGPASGSDTPALGIARNWTIAQVGATPAPNRLARITVSVNFNSGPSRQTLQFETMRAE